VDPWAVREVAFEPRRLDWGESIFALGNGHLGLRGNLEEGGPNAVDGTYVNGFYEAVPIIYPEPAFGYAHNRQVMLNVADAKPMRLSVDGEPFDLRTGTIEMYERVLDLHTAVLTRHVTWRSPAGNTIDLHIRRLVSLTRREVAAIDYRVSVKGRPATVRIESLVDATTSNQATGDDPRTGTRLDGRPVETIHAAAEESCGVLVQQTRNVGSRIAIAVEHDFSAGSMTGRAMTATGSPDGLEFVLSASLACDETLTLTKYFAYCTSMDMPPEAVIGAAEAASGNARAAGFDTLVAEQREALDNYWEVADVEIRGDDALQQGIRFNLLSLLQAAPDDGRTSICAKGLTGEGYEGHYFWDAETYAVPFFTHTHPKIARSLLQFRLRLMDSARDRARELGHAGILFPWRTIAGEETSPYFEAGTAQYHINADIAFALAGYLETTGDRGLLLEGAAELVFETARFWRDLGAYIPGQGGAFCINEVTGPDEYTALVNNNLYTNLMAQWNLRYATATANRLAQESPSDFARIAGSLNLTDGEIDEWTRAADLMRIPYDSGLGIHAQDDSFLTRARWDFDGTPAEKYPLLLHYHPLNVYRFQVLKQPDVVLAQVLLPDRFSFSDKKRNFDYYDLLTTGDSSLAPCIQSVAASQLGYTDLAYSYFQRTARMDLDNVGGNTGSGLHIAAMAGTWMSLVYGFAGMVRRDGLLTFDPRLPEPLGAMRFRLRILGRLLEVTVRQREATYELIRGEPISIAHRRAVLELAAGQPVTMDLTPRLQCVVFDLDGVITSSSEYHYMAWQRLADELGLPFDRQLNERLKGVSRLDSLDIILENAGKTVPPEERLRLAARKNDYFREMIKAIKPGDLLPGIGGLLRELKADGKKVAIASVSRNVWEIVDRLGIKPLVDVIVDPASLVKGKPDPEVFLRAAEMIGVPAVDCAGIEDAQVGIHSIKAAGMFAVGIGAALTEADWTLTGTNQLTYAALQESFRQHHRIG
jgi:alpha,alpha-trehalose phosphorylase